MNAQSNLSIGAASDDLSYPVVVPDLSRVLEYEIIWLDENVLNSFNNLVPLLLFPFNTHLLKNVITNLIHKRVFRYALILAFLVV